MAMLVLHSFGSHAGRYDRPAGDLALNGLTVEAFDLPGHGEAAGERGALGDWAAILDDVEDRLAALRADLPELPVALYGHGLGALIAADYQRSGRPPADAFVLLAPALARPERKRSLRESIVGRFRQPEPDRIVLDPSQMAADPELLESWRNDALAVWEYPPASVASIREAQARVGSNLDLLSVPIHIFESHDDPIAPLDHRVWHLTQDPPEHVMINMGGARHDMPSDTGWRERTAWHIRFLTGVAERHWPATVAAQPTARDFAGCPAPRRSPSSRRTSPARGHASRSSAPLSTGSAARPSAVTPNR